MSSSRSAFKPDASQQSVLVAARRGHVRIWGAAGSGKTFTVKALVVDVAARSGADSVRVMTSTRRTATLLRDGLALAVGAPTHGPLARSVSSFAHQVIVAAAGGAAHVKLIAGGQHDALLAELKTGQVMAAEHVGVLLSARERCALELRAGEIVEAAFVAAEFDADYFETARAVAAVAAILGGGQ